MKNVSPPKSYLPVIPELKIEENRSKASSSKISPSQSSLTSILCDEGPGIHEKGKPDETDSLQTSPRLLLLRTTTGNLELPPPTSRKSSQHSMELKDPNLEIKPTL